MNQSTGHRLFDGRLLMTHYYNFAVVFIFLVLCAPNIALAEDRVFYTASDFQITESETSYFI